MTSMLYGQKSIYIVLIDVFIVPSIRAKNAVSLIFVVCVEKRDKSIVLCYSAVRNTDLQI
jgi:hypothetical protein